MKYLQKKEEKMDKLWSGRTSGKLSYNAGMFMNSIELDKRLAEYDLIGNIAYSAALEKTGIINQKELELIVNGLKKVRDNLKNKPLNEYEDIHSAVEYELKKIIGDMAGKIHTGRSRNDQIVLDEKLFLKDYAIKSINSLIKLINSLVAMAHKNKDIIFPAYTHMQKAQPVLFSHYILSYFEKFLRDFYKIVYCFENMDIMPLGSGACTGSGYEIDTNFLARLLKFKAVSENSMDEVSGRDYIQDLIYVFCSIMIHLSRLCEDFIIYNTNEFSFLEISDQYSTGSSIMPQKKNPDILELVRGKSAIVSGNLVQIITLHKGLPSTYNRDLQEDKQILFQAGSETLSSVEIIAEILENISLNESAISENLKEGFLEATDIADYLVKKGENFREAHHITGRLVSYCIKHNKKVNELSLPQLKTFSSLIESDFWQKTSLENCIDSKLTACGTNRKNVQKKLESAFKKIGEIEDKKRELSKRIITMEELLRDLNHETD